MANHKSIVKEYGELAENVERRLNAIRSAPTSKNLLSMPGRYHFLNGERKGQMACSVSGNYRMIFRPIIDPGGDILEAVEAEIIEVIDYHNN